MAENEVVRVIRIKGVPEGLDAVAAKLNAVEDAYAAVAQQGDKAAAATQRVEKSQLSARTAFDRVQRSLDEQYRMQERLARAQSDLQRAYDQGLVSEQRRAQLLELASRKYGEANAAATAYANAIGRAGTTANDNFAKSAGLARHEMINLGRQAQDVATQLAMGQSPFQVLSSQAAQIADIFMSTQGTVGGFFRQAAAGVARFAMSGAGLATGGALIGGAALLAGSQYADGQREIERAMAGVGRQSGITVGQINRLSESYADAAKVSRSTARDMITAFASTGRIDAGNLPDTAGLTRNFAAMTGAGATDAAKTLAAAFVDPTRGAQELNKQIGFLDARTLDYIRTAQAQGRLGEAQRALSETLGQSIQGAADRTSNLAKAWDAVWNAATRAWDGIGAAVGGQISLEDKLAKAIENRARMEDGGRSGGMWSRWSAGERAQADSTVSDIQEQIRRRNQQQDRDARTARQGAASLAALAVVDELNPFGAEMLRLQGMASALQKGLKEAGDALKPDQAQQVREAYERITAAIQSALPPAERQRQINELALQSINARTLAERTAVEVAKLQQDSAFRLLETEQQRLTILGKINEMQAQANREARDAARSARDQADLVNLRPYQRRLAENRIADRDLRERVGGGYIAPLVGTMANGMAAQRSTGPSRVLDALDAIERFESGGKNIPNYKFGPGYTAQGHFQITNSTWKDIAKSAGIDLGVYPNAMSAPYDVQRQAAAALYQQRGFQPWAPHNPGLRGYIAANGGPSAFGAAGGTASLTNSALSDRDYVAQQEAYNSIVRSANDNLRAQQAQLEATRQTMFQTTEEVVKAQKYQELYNQAVQEGGTDLANRLAPSLMQVAAGYGALARQQEEVQRTQEAMKTIGDLGRQTISGFVSDLRNGASGAEIFRNALDRIASKLMDMALNDLFGKAFGNNSMGLFSNGGFFSSLFGGFGGSGSGNIAAGTGGLIAVGSGGGYASGGFTGAGGRNDPAGIVHRGEYVFSAASVNRIGLGNLDSMHRGALRGYAEGGYVSPAPYIHPPANQNGSLKVDIHNTVSDRADVKVGRNRDGSLKVMITAIKGDIAQDLARGQGSIPTALRATQDGRQLRG